MGLIALAGAGVIAACGGSTNAPGGTSNCAAAVPALLYPAPNSTGVPDGNFDVYIGYAGNPAGVVGPPALLAGGAVAATGNQWTAPSPGPTNPPGLLPPPPGDSYWTSRVTQTLSPSTAYTVRVTLSGCANAQTLGSFTTL